ncbi:hypothetical protein ACIP93_37475 [Streptomyces sp. NPDC088745]|uniref:hypothetical protein n=1 Tax=Streptomyces sp. NPDC088745 TaxID=3365884 RepID=UPI0037FB0003
MFLFELAAPPTGAALSNLVLTICGNVLTAYLGFSALRLYMKKEYEKAPTWLAGAVFVGFFTYFPAEAKTAIAGIAKLVPGA